MRMQHSREPVGPRFSSWVPNTSLVLVVMAAVGGCATTGSTWRSGVGDAFLEHPPFYAGAERETLGGSSGLGHLPVTYQRGASQPALFDPAASDAVTSFLGEMTRYLDEAGGGVRLVPVAGMDRPPDVRFGCVTESGDPEDDCADRGDGALGRGGQPMHLAVGRPSPEWIAGADSLMRTAGVEHVLMITLEVGQYWIRQRGLLGTKEVELGTDHVARLPWLTSLEESVAVVQLTGALVGRDGQAIRIGAEGLLAKRTPMAVSVLGAQSIVTDEDIHSLRETRREDLPDRPLVWQAAVQALVEQLTGGGPVASATQHLDGIDNS